MKKLLFTLLIAISITFSGFAQNQNHLTFKGIPIEGSMSSFCQKIKAKGFTEIDRDNTTTVFTGDFTGRNAMVGVTSSNDGKDVFGVTVIFESSEEWNTLVNTYDYYKDLYTRKYGAPSFSKEKNPAYGDANIYKMHELSMGTVVWGSKWDVEGGTIEISIEKGDNFGEGMVIILYRDSQNVEAKIQSDLEEI